MRIFYTLFISLLTLTAQGQFYLQTGYSASLPQQDMNRNINLLHSVKVGGYYRLPDNLKRVWVGADLGWGMYALTTKTQTFRFRDGSSTVTQVNYSSNVVQAAMNARVTLLEDAKVLPYVSGRAGYTSFYSNIFIEDPMDIDGCRPLDQRNIIRDGTGFAGYGGGLMLDWRLFSRHARKNGGWIDLSVTNIRGGRLDYINTKKLIDPSNPPTDSDGKPLNVQFVNATTNEIHEHQVAQVFSTPLRMLEIRLSAVFSIGR